MRTLLGLLSILGTFASLALAQTPASTGQTPASRGQTPATAVQAASALDLSTFPLVDAVDEPNHRVIASQSYTAQGSVLGVTKKLQTQLVAAGLKEVAGAMLTDDYSNVNFQKDGFSFSLNVAPGSKPGTSTVNIFNFGNVNLKQLPKLAGAKELYSLPSMIAFTAEGTAQDTTASYRSLLEKAGWQRFGETSASFFVKQNAVRLQVSISDAPGQAGKVNLQIASEQLSADLPAPPDCEFLQYSDPTGGMLFDTAKSQADLVRYFISELGKSQWKPTTENPVRIDFRDHLIFRNPKSEMIELQFYEVEGKTRCDLKYKTAAQMVEENKKADLLAAEMKRKREAEAAALKNPMKISIQAPKSAAVKSQTAKSIEFTCESGAARGIIAAWLKEQESKGWKKSVTIDTKEAGEFTLKKETAELSVSFIDPGFIPGSMTIQVRSNHQLQLTP
jgi:hypothetical protein